jgi:hypothetical protein
VTNAQEKEGIGRYATRFSDNVAFAFLKDYLFLPDIFFESQTAQTTIIPQRAI